MDLDAIFSEPDIEITPIVVAAAINFDEWIEWTEQRDGVTWRVVQRVGERVFPWCERSLTPQGIHAPRP